MARLSTKILGRWTVAIWDYSYHSMQEKSATKWIDENCEVFDDIRKMAEELNKHIANLPYKDTTIIEIGPAAYRVNGSPIGQRMIVKNHNRSYPTIIVTNLE